MPVIIAFLALMLFGGAVGMAMLSTTPASNDAQLQGDIDFWLTFCTVIFAIPTSIIAVTITLKINSIIFK